MEKKDRFDLLKNEKIDIEVYNYLETILKDLSVEIMSRENESFMSLANSGKLEGWCWQSTESAILFMPDDAVIYRGNLMFDEDKKYYHSFILFSYNGNEYVFDPCLVFINSAYLYFKTFEVEVLGQVSARDVKDYFIKYYKNPPKPKYYSEERMRRFHNFLKEIYGNIDSEHEVVVHDKEDPSAPMYRNGSGYKKLELDEDKILRLTVHYYMNA